MQGDTQSPNFFQQKKRLVSERVVDYPDGEMKIDQVAVQLYTLREFCKTAEDLALTARKVKKIGYSGVQISGVGPIAPSDIKKIMDGEGLRICATHEASDLIRKEPLKAVERLKEFGTNLTAYPFPAGVDFSDLASVDSMIHDLDRAGAIFREYDCSLSYHNHAVEFIKCEGETLMDRIFHRTKPENLSFELDTYWVQCGGGEPIAWCQKAKDRLPVLHLKDYGVSPTTKQPTFMEIGSGNLNFPAILAAAAESGCQWYIVEQDSCPGDPFDSIQKSFDYIKSHLVS